MEPFNEFEVPQSGSLISKTVLVEDGESQIFTIEECYGLGQVDKNSQVVKFGGTPSLKLRSHDGPVRVGTLGSGSGNGTIINPEDGWIDFGAQINVTRWSLSGTQDAAPPNQFRVSVICRVA